MVNFVVSLYLWRGSGRVRELNPVLGIKESVGVRIQKGGRVRQSAKVAEWGALKLPGAHVPNLPFI